ncbi:MAG: isoprenylcysteine carboxylmethyltransferase family protein [Pseudomonas sp.]|uniref:methyltransferase family protein n=1 Tax=Pseudomonas sp. TaxID=306 RepID=UPI00339663D7
MQELYHGAFLILGLALAFVSRRSLADPRSHGFFRFFAFEAIVFLLWRNLPFWFVERFSPTQLLSWVLLFSALYLLLHSLYLLRVRGGHAPERAAEESNFRFENTAQLVQSGIYGYIRHPLYSSLLLLTWGLFFKHPDLSGVAAALVGSLALVATAKVEEAENSRTFGEAYGEYCRRTRMFLPFLF